MVSLLLSIFINLNELIKLPLVFYKFNCIFINNNVSPDILLQIKVIANLIPLMCSSKSKRINKLSHKKLRLNQIIGNYLSLFWLSTPTFYFLISNCSQLLQNADFIADYDLRINFTPNQSETKKIIQNDSLLLS